MVTLLYLMVVGLAPLAHAWTERDAVAANQVHLHAPGHDCPPPHDEQHCPACQFSGQKILGGIPCRLPADAPLRVAATPFRQPVPAPRLLSYTPGPRAPPAV